MMAGVIHALSLTGCHMCKYDEINKPTVSNEFDRLCIIGSIVTSLLVDFS